jgi:hypothetical protein
MPIEMDGVEVLRWTASPPQAGRGVLGIGMISYNGKLVWTVTGMHRSGLYIRAIPLTYLKLTSFRGNTKASHAS